MFSAMNILPFAAASHAGETFRTILPYGLLAAVVIIVLHLVASRLVKAGPRKPWRWWESLVYLGVVAIIAWLGATSFVAVLRVGSIGGWWLFAHMFGAGALVAALPVFALMWADANRFLLASSEGEVAPPTKFVGLAKFAFWTILVSGLIVSGTMIVSMLPWLGTQGQQLMLDVHRYAGLVCVAAAGVHLYAVLYFAAIGRRQRQAA